ncbi:MAG: hypothetical protein PVJ00_07690 [Desulfobacterales bacterium]|jgi:hypothetical protein
MVYIFHREGAEGAERVFVFGFQTAIRVISAHDTGIFHRRIQAFRDKCFVHLDRSSDDLAAHLIDVHGFFPFFARLGFISFRPLAEKKQEKYPLRSPRSAVNPPIS